MRLEVSQCYSVSRRTCSTSFYLIITVKDTKATLLSKVAYAVWHERAHVVSISRLARRDITPVG